MSPTTEWGVPDWLRPQDYPNPKGPGAMAEWAWEFLRRNRSFRHFWVNKVEPFIRADGRMGRDAAGRFWPYHKEMRDAFGIMGPVESPAKQSNPAILRRGDGSPHGSCSFI
jgi:hypothetical protein